MLTNQKKHTSNSRERVIYPDKSTRLYLARAAEVEKPHCIGFDAIIILI
jgi:hypothetical protein